MNLVLETKKGEKKERNAVPPGTSPAETLGKCRVTAKPFQESLGWREEVDERDWR